MIQSLPESLRDIASQIGIEKTLAIVEKFAGRKIWIPRNPRSDWVMFEVLGCEAAGKLVKLCGGSQIEIPLCKAFRIAARNELIRKDRECLTIQKMIEKYGLCRWQLSQICNAKNV